MKYIHLLLVTAALGACNDAASTDPVDAVVDAGADLVVLDAQSDAPLAAGADAHVPFQPVVQPTEGEATLVGPGDLETPVPDGRARAGWVDEAAERLTGPEARCHVGCLRLDNAHISVCVQGESTFSQYTFQGGNIIDAHLAGAPGTDLLGQHFVAPGVGEATVESVGIVRDGSEGGAAVIRVEGRASGGRLIKGILAGPSFVPPDLRVVTEYRLEPGASHLDVLTWLTADRGSGQVGLMADVVLFGPRTRRLIFGEPTDVSLSAGFGDGIAYGWTHVDSRLDALAGSIDLLPFLPAVHGDFPPLRLGDTRLLQRRLHVAPDVEAMRRPPPEAREVTIRGPDGVQILVRTDDGALVTQATLAGGERALRLPPGGYTVEVLDWPGGAVAPVAFDAEALELTLPVPARLRVHVEDEDGRLLGARVRVAGRDLFVAGDADFSLPVGEHQAITTRGWHYAADVRTIALEAGGLTELRVVLPRVIDTAGWASGEFHQHASPSFDSEISVRDRVMSNLAEGVDFMVPTDHDIVFDYGAAVARLGLGDYIAAPLLGVEVSPIVGHFGAYGIEHDPTAGAGNAPPLPFQDADRNWHIHTVPELVEEARSRGAQLIQLNHPRAGSSSFDSAYFATTRFDPEAPVEANQHRHWTDDFDSIEIYNERERFCVVLRDWFGLLNQGRRVTGVGNSDTHGRTGDGHPRSYVPTSAEHPTGVSAGEIVDAVRNGRVSVGGGAVLDLPDGPLFGDEVRVHDAVWPVRVRVRTPPFTSVTRLVAFHNGRPVLDRPLAVALEEVVDLDEVLEVPVESDGYVVFVAVGERAAWVHTAVFAFGNPVWVDTDGDGVTPPGPVEVPLPDFRLCD